MNRANALRDEYRFNGPEAHKALLTRVVKRNHGNLQAAAWDLGVSDRNLRRHLLWAKLWPVVLEARKQSPRAGSDLLARALEKL